MVRVQIVDTSFCPETRRTPGVQKRQPSVNRTVVIIIRKIEQIIGLMPEC
jgi:hypothetical protein